MSFIENKYTRTYYKIVESAKSRNLPKESYTEKHHIMPKSLGGTNSDINIVRLTAREHFICHLLLTKMTTDNDMYKMKYALSMISNIKNIGKGRYTPSARLYEYAKKCHRDAIKKYWTDEKKCQHSEKLSQYNLTVDKTSDVYLNRIKKIRSGMLSRERTEKQKANSLKNCLANAAKRKGVPNPEHGDQVFEKYVQKNKELILRIWELFDNGLNRRKISHQLSVSWDRTNMALLRRDKIELVLYGEKKKK